MNKTGVTLCIIALNEREALENIWHTIPLTAFTEVYAIDGGSTDGTHEFFKKKKLKVLQQKRKGRGAAMREGLAHATQPFILFFSGDGNEDPRMFPAMIKELRKGADLVIAGRHLRKGAGSDNSDDSLLLRKLVTILFGITITFLWGGDVRDPINGLRAGRVVFLKKLKLTAQNHTFELQSTIRALKHKGKIVEIPTRELPRAGGIRKETAGSWILGITHLKCLWSELILQEDKK